MSVEEGDTVDISTLIQGVKYGDSDIKGKDAPYEVIASAGTMDGTNYTAPIGAQTVTLTITETKYNITRDVDLTVNAKESTGSENQENQENAESRDITVTGHADSEFRVGLPTSVVLTNDAQAGYATGNYEITVQGQLDIRKKLIVQPTDELSDKDGINMYVAQSGNEINKIQVNITDLKTEFVNSEIQTDNTVNCELKTIGLISSGSWSGVLNYNISIADIS